MVSRELDSSLAERLEDADPDGGGSDESMPPVLQ